VATCCIVYESAGMDADWLLSLLAEYKRRSPTSRQSRKKSGLSNSDYVNAPIKDKTMIIEHNRSSISRYEKIKLLYASLISNGDTSNFPRNFRVLGLGLCCAFLPRKFLWNSCETVSVYASLTRAWTGGRDYYCICWTELARKKEVTVLSMLWAPFPVLP
jgi:hypothetical protein